MREVGKIPFIVQYSLYGFTILLSCERHAPQTIAMHDKDYYIRTRKRYLRRIWATSYTMNSLYCR